MLSKSTEDQHEVFNRIGDLAEVEPEAALGAHVIIYVKKQVRSWLKHHSNLLVIDEDYNGIDDAGH